MIEFKEFRDPFKYICEHMIPLKTPPQLKRRARTIKKKRIQGVICDYLIDNKKPKVTPLCRNVPQGKEKSPCEQGSGYDRPLWLHNFFKRHPPPKKKKTIAKKVETKDAAAAVASAIQATPTGHSQMVTHSQMVPLHLTQSKSKLGKQVNVRSLGDESKKFKKRSLSSRVSVPPNYAPPILPKQSGCLITVEPSGRIIINTTPTVPPGSAMMPYQSNLPPVQPNVLPIQPHVSPVQSNNPQLQPNSPMNSIGNHHARSPSRRFSPAKSNHYPVLKTSPKGSSALRKFRLGKGLRHKYQWSQRDRVRRGLGFSNNNVQSLAKPPKEPQDKSLQDSERELRSTDNEHSEDYDMNYDSVGDFGNSPSQSPGDVPGPMSVATPVNPPQPLQSQNVGFHNELQHEFTQSFDGSERFDASQLPLAQKSNYVGSQGSQAQTGQTNDCHNMNQNSESQHEQSVMVYRGGSISQGLDGQHLNKEAPSQEGLANQLGQTNTPTECSTGQGFRTVGNVGSISHTSQDVATAPQDSQPSDHQEDIAKDIPGGNINTCEATGQRSSEVHNLQEQQTGRQSSKCHPVNTTGSNFLQEYSAVIGDTSERHHSEGTGVGMAKGQTSVDGKQFSGQRSKDSNELSETIQGQGNVTVRTVDTDQMKMNDNPKSVGSDSVGDGPLARSKPMNRVERTATKRTLDQMEGVDSLARTNGAVRQTLPGKHNEDGRVNGLIETLSSKNQGDNKENEENAAIQEKAQETEQSSTNVEDGEDEDVDVAGDDDGSADEGGGDEGGGEEGAGDNEDRSKVSLEDAGGIGGGGDDAKKVRRRKLVTKKMRNKLKRESEMRKKLMDPRLIETDDQMSGKESSFSKSFLTDVKTVFQATPEKYMQLLNCFQEFTGQVELCERVFKLLEDHPRLIEKFTVFLPLGTAREQRRLQECLEFFKVRRFLRQVEIYFSKQQSHFEKIVNTILEWEKAMDPASTLKENILPLLKGQPQLRQSFLALFADEKTEEVVGSRFEVFHIDSNDKQYDSYEEMEFTDSEDEEQDDNERVQPHLKSRRIAMGDGEDPYAKPRISFRRRAAGSTKGSRDDRGGREYDGEQESDGDDSPAEEVRTTPAVGEADNPYAKPRMSFRRKTASTNRGKASDDGSETDGDDSPVEGLPGTRSPRTSSSHTAVRHLSQMCDNLANELNENGRWTEEEDTEMEPETEAELETELEDEIEIEVDTEASDHLAESMDEGIPSPETATRREEIEGDCSEEDEIDGGWVEGSPLGDLDSPQDEPLGASDGSSSGDETVDDEQPLSSGTEKDAEESTIIGDVGDSDHVKQKEDPCLAPRSDNGPNKVPSDILPVNSSTCHETMPDDREGDGKNPENISSGSKKCLENEDQNQRLQQSLDSSKGSENQSKRTLVNSDTVVSVSSDSDKGIITHPHQSRDVDPTPGSKENKKTGDNITNLGEEESWKDKVPVVKTGSDHPESCNPEASSKCIDPREQNEHNEIDLSKNATTAEKGDQDKVNESSAILGENEIPNKLQSRSQQQELIKDTEIDRTHDDKRNDQQTVLVSSNRFQPECNSSTENTQEVDKSKQIANFCDESGEKSAILCQRSPAKPASSRQSAPAEELSTSFSSGIDQETAMRVDDAATGRANLSDVESNKHGISPLSGKNNNPLPEGVLPDRTQGDTITNGVNQDDRHESTSVETSETKCDEVSPSLQTTDESLPIQASADDQEMTDWNSEMDKFVLKTVHAKGDRKEIYDEVSRILKNKTPSEVEARYHKLISLLQSMQNHTGGDNSSSVTDGGESDESDKDV